MKRFVCLLAFLLFAGSIRIEFVDAQPEKGAELIYHNAKILTVDDKFTIAQAIAIKGDRIVAVGGNEAILKLKDGSTKVVDLKGKTILPGLYDSHTHPVGAATSELNEPLPILKSLGDVFAYIRKKASELPEGEWIILRYAFPTRLDEGRFPSKKELDEAAPKHPVLYNAGPASMVNSTALKVSGITKETKNPGSGVIVRDPQTGEPTGMLRSAEGVLKVREPASKAGGGGGNRREAVKTLFKAYNSYGLTSIADRSASRSNIDLYHDLLNKGELTIRLNVAPSFSAGGSREEIAKRFDNLPGKDGRDGPTGKGGVWIRIGPIKFFLDGGMLNGTAYMRQPWPPGPTYQIVEKDYRGLLFQTVDQVKIVAEEAAKRKWSVTAHCAGEGAMDVLLDAYEFVDRITPIKDLRFCITHANFTSLENLKRCQSLGVCADIQPIWLYKDATTLHKVLGPDRMRWFHPYKSWLKYTTIGGGSDHMIKMDPEQSTNPWNPWLGIETALTHTTERGLTFNPEEALSREEALRLYTINNAYLGHEEKEKGSLEAGKLADLIVIDRDYMTTPVKGIAQTRVLLTVVGGKVVHEAQQ
jgi:predicted amidohydrolase YtcJ